METIKVGLAAFGMSGSVFHAPFLKAHPKFRLTKIVERTKTLSRTNYPEAIIVRSVDELINDSGIDLVVVNTPDSTHYEYTRKALLAGKHVIVEKPFTTTVKEAEELVEIAGKSGLALSVFQNRRWDADFLTVKEILNKKMLGNLVEFESTFARYRNFIKPDTWKESGNLGGGLTYNLGAHLIDQAVELFGMPEAIFATIATLRKGGMVDDYFMIHLLRPRMNPKIKVTLKASYLMCEPEPRFILHGTEGSFIKYGVDNQEEALISGKLPTGAGWGKDKKHQWGTLHTCTQGKVQRYPYPNVPGNYEGFYNNIYEHIAGKAPLLTSGKDNIRIIKLIEAAYRSQKENAVITL